MARLYPRNPSPLSFDEGLLRYLEEEFAAVEDAIRQLDPYGRWDDMRSPASRIITGGGAGDPDRDTDDGALLFSDTITERVFIHNQTSHRWAQGTLLRPHVHWGPTDTSPGSVRWKYEYKIANVGDAFPASWLSLSVTDASDAVLRQHQVAPFGNLDTTGFRKSCIILGKLTRDRAHAEDTYGSDAKLYEFDIHWQADGFGTSVEFPGASF